MNLSSWHKRIVPATTVVIGLLFMEKAVGLAREATAKDVMRPEPAVALPPLPSPQPLPIVALSGPSEPVSAVASEELQLLQDLRRRRQLLDGREQSLDQRADLLKSAQSKLEDKLSELLSLQKHLDQLEDIRRSRMTENWSGLVKTYEDMKPKDAATIFNVLDIHVLLEVLDRMDERKAAAVLANMTPERARLATQMLAQKRTHQDSPSVTLPLMEQHS